MRQLTLTNTLEFYDVPQILTASDATGTRYLCTLYTQEADGYRYLGVQLSEPRLKAFVGGQLDLRDAYLYPEVDNALYVVTAKQESLYADTLLQPSELTEDMLPESGYCFDASDFIDDADTLTDTYKLEVPVLDRITFYNNKSYGMESLLAWRNTGQDCCAVRTMRNTNIIYSR